jgi:hypothetical protein
MVANSNHFDEDPNQDQDLSFPFNADPMIKALLVSQREEGLRGRCKEGRLSGHASREKDGWAGWSQF